VFAIDTNGMMAEVGLGHFRNGIVIIDDAVKVVT